MAKTETQKSAEAYRKTRKDYLQKRVSETQESLRTSGLSDKRKKKLQEQLKTFKDNLTKIKEQSSLKETKMAKQSLKDQYRKSTTAGTPETKVITTAAPSRPISGKGAPPRMRKPENRIDFDEDLDANEKKAYLEYNKLVDKMTATDSPRTINSLKGKLEKLMDSLSPSSKKKLGSMGQSLEHIKKQTDFSLENAKKPAAKTNDDFPNESKDPERVKARQVIKRKLRAYEKLAEEKGPKSHAAMVARGQLLQLEEDYDREGYQRGEKPEYKSPERMKVLIKQWNKEGIKPGSTSGGKTTPKKPVAKPAAKSVPKADADLADKANKIQAKRELLSRRENLRGALMSHKHKGDTKKEAQTQRSIKQINERLKSEFQGVPANHTKETNAWIKKQPLNKTGLNAIDKGKKPRALSVKEAQSLDKKKDDKPNTDANGKRYTKRGVTQMLKQLREQQESGRKTSNAYKQREEDIKRLTKVLKTLSSVNPNISLSDQHRITVIANSLEVVTANTVWGTGATYDELAKALKKIGIKGVTADGLEGDFDEGDGVTSGSEPVYKYFDKILGEDDSEELAGADGAFVFATLYIAGLLGEDELKTVVPNANIRKLILKCGKGKALSAARVLDNTAKDIEVAGLGSELQTIKETLKVKVKRGNPPVLVQNTYPISEKTLKLFGKKLAALDDWSYQDSKNPVMNEDGYLTLNMEYEDEDGDEILVSINQDGEIYANDY